MNVGLAAIAITATLGLGSVSAQDYPSRPIRIVSSVVGGGTDFAARLVAQGLSLGQSVIVDNRTAVQSAEIVSKAPADGYTLLVAGGQLWIASLLAKTLYDPIKDFSPITLVERSPNIVVVHPSVPVKSVKELIALAKAKPGELNCGSPGIGGSSHLAYELFKSMAGVNIVRIPYKSNGPALNDLVGGHIQLAFPSATAAVAHMKSGRLRALAVTSPQPSALAPGLPTVAASGLPGYDATGMTGIFAPAKTSGAIINRLSQEIVRVLNQPDVKEKLFNAGMDAAGSSPEQFAATIKADMANMGKVIKDAGIKAE